MRHTGPHVIRRGPCQPSGPRRRAIIAAIPVAAGLAACTSSPYRKPQPGTLLYFTGHQAAVVEAATARIAPGPQDDPAEAGHPGARGPA